MDKAQGTWRTSKVIRGHCLCDTADRSRAIPHRQPSFLIDEHQTNVEYVSNAAYPEISSGYSRPGLVRYVMLTFIGACHQGRTLNTRTDTTRTRLTSRECRLHVKIIVDGLRPDQEIMKAEQGETGLSCVGELVSDLVFQSFKQSSDPTTRLIGTRGCQAALARALRNV